MMKSAFDKYSRVGIYKFFNKGFNSWEWFVYSDLNKTFDFLLEKPQEIPEWILGSLELFYAFMAGYTDSEGCWRIVKSHKKFVRFIFKIDSMDKQILEQIKEVLENSGVRVNFYLKFKKGTIRNGIKCNNDLYSLVVYRKRNVILLTNKLLPLSRHQEKIAIMKLVLDNSENNSWDKLGNQSLELRNRIKETRLK